MSPDNDPTTALSHEIESQLQENPELGVYELPEELRLPELVAVKRVAVQEAVREEALPFPTGIDCRELEVALANDFLGHKFSWGESGRDLMRRLASVSPISRRDFYDLVCEEFPDHALGQEFMEAVEIGYRVGLIALNVEDHPHGRRERLELGKDPSIPHLLAEHTPTTGEEISQFMGNFSSNSPFQAKEILEFFSSPEFQRESDFVKYGSYYGQEARQFIENVLDEAQKFHLLDTDVPPDPLGLTQVKYKLSSSGLELLNDLKRDRAA